MGQGYFTGVIPFCLGLFKEEIENRISHQDFLNWIHLPVKYNFKVDNQEALGYFPDNMLPLQWAKFSLLIALLSTISFQVPNIVPTLLAKKPLWHKFNQRNITY